MRFEAKNYKSNSDFKYFILVGIKAWILLSFCGPNGAQMANLATEEWPNLVSDVGLCIKQ